MKRIILCLVLATSLDVFSFPKGLEEEVFQSIVKIHAIIPPDAQSAGTLGRERTGNGVVIDSKGNILTIGYLVSEAESIEITKLDGKKLSASFVAYDQASGFGIVRADSPLDVAPLRLGDSSAVKEGDVVVVAGSGGSGEAQVGRVLARKEFAGYWEYLVQEAIFVVPTYESFGGAALVDKEGRLVGIGSLLSHVWVQGVGLVPSNMFVPINLLKPILFELVTLGKSPEAPRPWLGINSEEYRGRVFISRLTSGGPAERAGLLPGDLVVTVEGKTVRGLADFYKKIWGAGGVGVEVTLRILRDDKLQDVKIITEDRTSRQRQKVRRVL